VSGPFAYSTPPKNQPDSWFLLRALWQSFLVLQEVVGKRQIERIDDSVLSPFNGSGFISEKP
jgi:hypothetical protein